MSVIGCHQWTAKKRSKRRAVIFNTIKRLALERGRAREKKFEEAAQLLKENGLICHHYKSLRDDHKKKTDRYIKRDSKGIFHKIQIKGSEQAAEEFLDNFRGSDPPLVFVLSGTESVEEITHYILIMLDTLRPITIVGE